MMSKLENLSVCPLYSRSLFFFKYNLSLKKMFSFFLCRQSSTSWLAGQAVSTNYSCAATSCSPSATGSPSLGSSVSCCTTSNDCNAGTPNLPFACYLGGGNGLNSLFSVFCASNVCQVSFELYLIFKASKMEKRRCFPRENNFNLEKNYFIVCFVL